MNSTPMLLAGMFAGFGILAALMHPTMPIWFGALGGLGIGAILLLIALAVEFVSRLGARRRG